MANCKICGQPVRSAKVILSACWETAANKVAAEFCGNYCRWPRECQDEESLAELHCSECAMVRLLNLGL